jgi:hypothetical protein
MQHCRLLSRPFGIAGKRSSWGSLLRHLASALSANHLQVLRKWEPVTLSQSSSLCLYFYWVFSGLENLGRLFLHCKATRCSRHVILCITATEQVNICQVECHKKLSEITSSLVSGIKIENRNNPSFKVMH